MPHPVVVANASSLRPWQVLIVEKDSAYVHGSFKTRKAAIESARAINGGSDVQIIAKIEDVHEQIFEPMTLFQQSGK